jgi:hypothetical protein
MVTSADELKIELIAEEKYHEERIGHVERNFAALSVAMGGIARKTALMRDKGDKLTKTIRSMSCNEVGTVRTTLESLAECLGGIEDYRQTEVCVERERERGRERIVNPSIHSIIQLDRLEAKVVKPLLDYDNTCRKAKDELKSCCADRAKVVNQQRALEKTRIREPTNRKKLSQMETDLQKAKFKRIQSTKTLEDHMQGFERKRIHDLKVLFQEYINTGMIFHAKSLELHTIAHQILNNIDESEAIENYMNNVQSRKRSSIMEDQLPTSMGTPTLHRTSSEPSLVS